MIVISIVCVSLCLAIVFLIISIMACIDGDEKTSNKSAWIGTISIVIMIILGIYNPPSEFRYSYSYNIYALEDNFTIQGRGGRFSFYIEEDAKYYHLADYKGGKKMYAISKNNSYIVEKDGVKPKIEVYESAPVSNKFINWLYEGMRVEKEYKIIVPKQTLTNGFNIDMKK